jgi:hypothetical protein
MSGARAIWQAGPARLRCASRRGESFTGTPRHDKEGSVQFNAEVASAAQI